MRRFFKRLISPARRQEDEERLRAEIEEHLALQTGENIRAGMAPAEARRQAVLKLGAVEAIKGQYRSERRLPFLEAIVRDARYAVRQLRGSPAFAFSAVLALGPRHRRQYRHLQRDSFCDVAAASFCRRGGDPCLRGIALGAAGSAATNRLLEHIPYMVSFSRPLLLIIASLCMALIGVLAAYLPARRAASIDPVRALRVE